MFVNPHHHACTAIFFAVRILQIFKIYTRYRFIKVNGLVTLIHVSENLGIGLQIKKESWLNGLKKGEALHII